MDRRSVGKAGEDAAVDFLKKKGYRIIERNVRCRRGEIDVVARDAETICFVEVRTRRDVATHALPLESVDARKRRRLAGLAAFYLQRRGWSERRVRFDVVSVVMEEGRSRIALVQNAFSLSDIPFMS